MLTYAGARSLCRAYAAAGKSHCKTGTPPSYAERGAIGGEWGGGCGGCQQEKPSTVACLLNNKFNRQEMNACISALT
jgi:hypothetical protein